MIRQFDYVVNLNAHLIYINLPEDIVETCHRNLVTAVLNQKVKEEFTEKIKLFMKQELEKSIYEKRWLK